MGNGWSQYGSWTSTSWILSSPPLAVRPLEPKQGLTGSENLLPLLLWSIGHDPYVVRVVMIKLWANIIFLFVSNSRKFQTLNFVHFIVTYHKSYLLMLLSLSMVLKYKPQQSKTVISLFAAFQPQCYTLINNELNMFYFKLDKQFIVFSRRMKISSCCICI